MTYTKIMKFSKKICQIAGAFLLLELLFFAMSQIDFIKQAKNSVLCSKVEAASVLNAKSYGAKGNGSTNDTAAIQAAINSLGATGGTVVIPPGTYLIDAVKSINLKSQVTLQMSPTTFLKVIPNSSDWSAVLKLNSISYANIYSGVLMGDRYSHLSATGEHGMGISVLGAKNVVVQGTLAKNMWGDGFYIGSATNGAVPRNIQLIDVTAYNNRRQGISLIAGYNVSIIRPTLTKTNGTDPSAGLDIEPNKITDTLQYIKIIDAYTANNEGAGIAINLVKLEGTTVPVSIKITNHVDNGSQRGFYSVNGTGVIPGSLVLDNPIWKNNKLNGFAVTNHDYRSYKITVNNPQVINANTTGPKGYTTGSAFAMYSYKSAAITGNIHINNAEITDTRTVAKITAGFYVANISGKKVVNLTIVNPIINGKILKVLQTSTSTGAKVQ